MNADSYGERSSVGLGRAMLALFISSVLTAVIQLGIWAIGAEPHSLGGGLLYFIAFVVLEALMLRLCLGWFGWTISLKAAIVARLLAAVAAVIAVVALFSAAPLRNVVVGFLVAFVVQYLVAGWIVVLTADPLDPTLDDDQPAKPWSPAPAPAWQDDSTAYTAEDFLADSQRARAQSSG
jgi:hypothetical protein